MDLAWVAVLGPFCAGVGFVLDRVVGPGHDMRKRIHGFLEDWEGEPERRTPDGARLLEERRPGMPERVATLEMRSANTETDVGEIKHLLNGGGLGHQVAELDSKISDHIDQAGHTRSDILKDIREARQLVGEAVTVLTTNQQRLEEQIDALDGKVERRLFTLEESERTHRAILHEIGIPVADEPATD